ncbi:MULTISPECIES: nitroreductase family protein [unclassified Methanoregula]|uniref:nitroreductase family protein n=1 Tax=unclassified Methanoregula TaxID=2649730 RepID=UPI0009D0A520|nr:MULTISPECIES: nitroreductase family protein [unclassified Methanoregula]OPX62157.1 MAG: nitroreductase A [Methanoregula sp. PtaB.Bin085]OPY35634.1 MAG: nitroreductase A [Methanoregula sp. PtaU1.Bin006]
MDSSDFFGLCAGRSSVREYDDEPVTDDEIGYVLKCAGTAPSAGNLEAWDVVVVRDDETKEALSEAAFSQEHIRLAPVVLAVCANYVRSMSRYGERGILYGLEDATIACTYMMLAAHSRGLVTCWTGAFDDEAVREVLDLPQHSRPVSLLAVGKGHAPAQHTERMSIGEHVHRDTW